ncbi:glycosyltransferase [Salegentibacter sp. JZCK2]|uniref:glycosyltransferase n=1 Tax=Salegentibacter tibetensis TaxID=2873600 RepID=UPI001CD026F3|nr:glycosyltransferase [Salegentibacter tibetensis]MBZ9729745.1 glycosyltransferase [Salegentibacter tibetensis]
MTNLRIAFLVTTFPTVSETFIVNQIIDLKKRGHEVKIFAFQKNEKAIAHRLIPEYNLLDHVYYQKIPEYGKIERFFKLFGFLKRKSLQIDFSRFLRIFNYSKFGKKALNLSYFTRYKWILDHDLDIIHAHFGPNGVYAAEMKNFGFLKKTKLVTTFHGYDIHPARIASYQNTYKDLFRFSDAITCNTKYTADLLAKFDCFQEPMILPVGLDTDFFKRGHFLKSSKNIRLIFIGRLIALKGAEILISIFYNLYSTGYKDLELVIIGEGPIQKKLVEKVENLNLKNKVSFLGSLTQEEIIEELSKADIFVLPGIVDESGRSETQGLVIQEAQAMELPVVVSDAGGMKYGLINGETGYVIASGNISQFSNKIEGLLENSDKREKMGKAGRKFVVENYHSKILGDQLEKIYRDL